MNYAKIKKYDTANGHGVRTSVFFSGCRFDCKGCFNKELQDFKYGNKYTQEIEDLIVEHVSDTHVVGLSLLGGEVFQQNIDSVLSLVKRVKAETGKSIYAWTGYTYEELSEKQKELLPYIDYLIDGQFKEELKDLSLQLKGSSNQRVIDIKKSLSEDKIVIYK